MNTEIQKQVVTYTMDNPLNEDVKEIVIDENNGQPYVLATPRVKGTSSFHKRFIRLSPDEADNYHFVKVHPLRNGEMKPKVTYSDFGITETFLWYQIEGVPFALEAEKDIHGDYKIFGVHTLDSLAKNTPNSGRLLLLEDALGKLHFDHQNHYDSKFRIDN